MILLQAPPSLSMVREFIEKVRKYPVSVGELSVLARQTDAPQEIIDLYSIFPSDTIFKDNDDLTARSELVSILESQEEPGEALQQED